MANNNKFFISASNDGSINVIHQDKNDFHIFKSFNYHQGSVISACVSYDSKRIISGSDD